jgi:hypothetical protein
MSDVTFKATPMEHFPIIQALCRAALASPNAAARKQIERLRDSLAKEGEAKQAAVLQGILSTAEKTEDMAPSRLVRSRAAFAGENLTANTPLPVDRETSTPLAQLLMPADLNMSGPMFNGRVTGAVRSLLEEWTHMEELEAMHVGPAKTLLIYGVPGTGKTRLALWLAKQLDLPIVVARLESLVSSFLGTSARNIGALFGFANRYRCLLLLDEFDALAKLRDDPQEVGEIKRIVNTLLQNLDVRQDVGLTIGITNHPQLLDSAVWRRFEAQLEIPTPDLSLRLEMAHVFMRPVAVPESHLKLLAWFTEGATGAELETLVRSYKKLRAVRGEQPDVIEVFRQFATMNSGRLERDRRELLFGDERMLVKALAHSTTPAFTQSEVAELLGKDKSTVSRVLNKKASEL